MRVVAVPDKFRGSAGAIEVAQAMAIGATEAGWRCDTLPLADGGEGTLEALGGANRTTVVTGPLGALVPAEWRLTDQLAVIEVARACGLTLAGGRARNDPMSATTRGVGELITAAIRAGASRIVVGVGGSATTDGGIGAVEALAPWCPLARHGVRIEVACDVSTTFVDAARVFAPQKGASEADVVALTSRLEELGARYAHDYGNDIRALAGSGAAGGLGGGLAAIGASLVPGFDLIADELGLDDALARADAVVTGEGSFDTTSLEGKVVGGVLRRARARALPVIAIVGEASLGEPDGMRVISLVHRFGRERAWAATATCIARATRTALHELEPVDGATCPLVEQDHAARATSGLPEEAR